ncbi:major facilitator superfamily domain-containing protein [Ditylenchus destructor]|nr:major facilitator superfamily domain-containing protein [Ditylenchus destructor]
MENWWNQLVLFVKNLKLHTEPIILLIALCNGARNVLQPHLSEAKMERAYIPPAGLDPAAVKRYYNKRMVQWEQYYSYVNMPTVCIMGLFYGAYSDRKGRKLPILLGILSNLVDTLMRTLVWWDVVDLDLNWIFLDAIINGLMGGTALIMVNAYLVDKFKSKALSVRMILFSTVFSLGGLIGVQFSSLLLRCFGYITVLFLIQLILVINFLFALFVLDNEIPHKSESIESLGDVPSSHDPPTLCHIFNQGVKSLCDSLRIFTRRRPGHCRLFLYMCFFVNFLDQMIFSEEMDLIGVYTRLSPFNWDTEQYAVFKTLRPIVILLGMLFGVVVLKGVLKLRDTLIIVLAILSMGSAALVIGIASSSTLVYLSLIAGSLHGLLTPLAYTFMANLVFLDEVGKTFALTAIAAKLAVMGQSLILQNIYIWTVDWYQSFIWLLLAALSFGSAIVYCVMDVMARREGIGQNANAEND